MKEIAIIGPTASGKSDLALRIAHNHNAYILSIDSLSIYQEIDIASAKPSLTQRQSLQHFGIDVLLPNSPFNVATFINLYREASIQAKQDAKNLVIVGGTSFYLKMLLSGLSEIPTIEEHTYQRAAQMLSEPLQAYQYLYQIDPEYMKHIKANDTYRVEKMLLLHLQTDKTPTQWFNMHPPEPVIDELPLFDIAIERAFLRERIAKRTKQMVSMGLVDEVADLEQRYTRAPNSMKAIGIVEVLEYLDGRYSLNEMTESIRIHTAQLAKRQQTYNKNQFKERTVMDVLSIEKEVAKIFG